MKRGEPLRRNTPLARGGTPLARSKGLGRGNGRLGRSDAQIARKAPKGKATIPAAVREAVYKRDEGRCRRCREVVGRGLFERALHHVLPERTWPQFVAVAANVILVCATCHVEHEFGARDDSRLPFDCLPGDTMRWIAGLPDGPIGVYIERTYHGWGGAGPFGP